MVRVPFPDPGFGFASAMFTIIPLIVIGGFVYVIGSSLFRWYANETSPVEERYATVMTKRTNVSGGGHNHHAHTSYHVTFQFDDGDRLELSVRGSDYGVLVEGDNGLLNYQGTRLNRFDRN